MVRLHDALADRIDRLGPAWVKDPDGRYLTVGAGLADWLGAEREAMVGRRDEEFWPTAAVRQFRVDDHAALARGRAVAVPEHRTADRADFLVTLKLPLGRPDGRPVGTLGLFHRARPEGWPRQAEARYRTLLDEVGPALDALELTGHRAGLDPTFRDRTALASPAMPAWLDDVRARLIAGFRGRVRVAELARQVDVHPGHLGRAFRESFGIGVHGFVRRLRIDWACVELRSTRRPAGEIGIAAGFSDQSHFTREFCRTVGVPPGRYRTSVRGG
ncbi:MAG: helix-turn-helix domain-containing protein [Gemmatimonadota bacterium]